MRKLLEIYRLLYLGEKFEGQFLAGDRGKELQISSATIHNYFQALSFLVLFAREGEMVRSSKEQVTIN